MSTSFLESFKILTYKSWDQHKKTHKIIGQEPIKCKTRREEGTNAPFWHVKYLQMNPVIHIDAITLMGLYEEEVDEV